VMAESSDPAWEPEVLRREREFELEGLMDWLKERQRGRSALATSGAFPAEAPHAPPLPDQTTL
jgi:hypothetical protein